ncbi:MAG: hypothetical protein NZL89_03340, partial [Leptospiraceae bacterium]|nr:hypothetical protein [Leptospiraceae bacterium]
ICSMLQANTKASASGPKSTAGGLAERFAMEFSFGGSIGLWHTQEIGSPWTPTFVGTPAVGFRYHFTDLIAIAPYIGFFTAKTVDNTNNTAPAATKSIETTVTAWGVGLEVPFYLTKLQSLYLYVAPGIGYTPVSYTRKTTRVDGLATETAPKGNFLSLYAALGLQVPITEQLHALAKVTVGYASGTINPDTKANPVEPDDTSNYFGLQSWAIGALFYFN